MKLSLAFCIVFFLHVSGFHYLKTPRGLLLVAGPCLPTHDYLNPFNFNRDLMNKREKERTAELWKESQRLENIR